MGCAPGNSCKRRLILEKSDQDKLSDTIIGSQGFCLDIFFFKKYILSSLKLSIFFILKKSSLMFCVSSGVI